MPKPELTPDLSQLESDILETLLAGHHEYRPDLAYPESHSDMHGAIRGLMRMFDVRRRPLPVKLKTPCHDCGGLGYMKVKPMHTEDCKTCNRRGYLLI